MGYGDRGGGPSFSPRSWWPALNLPRWNLGPRIDRPCRSAHCLRRRRPGARGSSARSSSAPAPYHRPTGPIDRSSSGRQVAPSPRSTCPRTLRTLASPVGTGRRGSLTSSWTTPTCRRIVSTASVSSPRSPPSFPSIERRACSWANRPGPGGKACWCWLPLIRWVASTATICCSHGRRAGATSPSRSTSGRRSANPRRPYEPLWHRSRSPRCRKARQPRGCRALGLTARKRPCGRGLGEVSSPEGSDYDSVPASSTGGVSGGVGAASNTTSSSRASTMMVCPAENSL
jgi:hypothetical protein